MCLCVFFIMHYLLFNLSTLPNSECNEMIMGRGFEHDLRPNSSTQPADSPQAELRAELEQLRGGAICLVCF